MVKCPTCEREFKSNAGLSRHSQSCKGKVEETVEDEPEKEVVEEKVETPAKTEKKELDPAMESKLYERKKKLIAAIAQCKDAKAKHDLEKELKRTMDML